jgi:hypothetical protein
LPAFNRAIASSGDVSFCRACVNTAHSADWAWAAAGRPVKAVAAAQPQNILRFSMEKSPQNEFELLWDGLEGV